MKKLISNTIFSMCYLIVLASIYIYGNNNNNIWILIGITVIAIWIFKFNKKKTKESVKVYIPKLQTKESFKIKKRYLIWIVIATFYIKNGLLKYWFEAPSSPLNEKGVEKYTSETPLFEALMNTSFLSPIVEEIIFRGMLLAVCVSTITLILRLKSNTKERTIGFLSIATFIILSTFLFGLAHVVKGGDYVNIAPYAMAGAVFSILYILTKTLLAPILLHMINNGLSTFVQYHEIGELNFDIAVIILFCLLVYMVFSMLWWGIKHSKSLDKILDDIEKECKNSEINRRKAIKKIYSDITNYVKRQMIIR